MKALLVIVVGSAIAGGISIAIAEALVSSGQDYEDNTGALTALLVASFIVQELLALGAVAWFAVRKYRVSWATLGLRKAASVGRWFPVTLAAAALVLIYGYTLVYSLVTDTPGDPAGEKAFGEAMPLLVLIIGAIMLAPVIEEIFFRGFVYGAIVGRRGWVVAAIASGILFGAAHLSIYAMLPFTGVGVLFAWSYNRTGSIRPSIVAHFLVNTVSMTLGVLSGGTLVFG